MVFTADSKDHLSLYIIPNGFFSSNTYTNAHVSAQVQMQICIFIHTQYRDGDDIQNSISSPSLQM